MPFINNACDNFLKSTCVYYLYTRMFIIYTVNKEKSSDIIPILNTKLHILYYVYEI